MSNIGRVGPPEISWLIDIMRSYYPWLDLLRFGSALSVAFFHHMFWSWTGNVPGTDHNMFADYPQFPFAVSFTWFGWVGVEVFFVISGFVIANSASKASPVEFLISRALKLYPAVWVCSTATVVVLFFFEKLSLPELFGPYVKSLLLIPRGQWVDGVYWTLAVEISFYALVFFLLVLKRVTLLHMAWGLTVYSGIFNAFALLVVLGGDPSSKLYLFLAWRRISWAPLLLYHGCFFALGIWFFIAANRKLTSFERFGLILAFLCGTAEVFNTSVELFNASWSILKYFSGISGQSPLVPVAVFAAAMCIVGFATRESRYPAARVAGEGHLRTLGLITYPFYLTHNVVGAGATRLLIAAGLDASLAVCVALSGLLALCWLFCSKVEPAIRTLLRQFLLHLGLRYRKQSQSFPNSAKQAHRSRERAPS